MQRRFVFVTLLGSIKWLKENSKKDQQRLTNYPPKMTLTLIAKKLAKMFGFQIV